MYTSDNSKIRFDPSDEGEYHSEDIESKPVPGLKSTKDFKKVLGQQGKFIKADEELIKKKKTPSRLFSEELKQDNIEENFLAVNQKLKKDDEENAAQGAFSLFDLSKGSSEQSKDEKGNRGQSNVAAVDEKSPAQSPSDLLFKRTTNTELPKQFPKLDKEEAKVDAKHVTETDGSKPAELKKDHPYRQEQPDLSYVNPFAAIPPVQQINPSTETKVERAGAVDTAMQDLVSQLVKQLYTIETIGKTDTVIVLQYPPLFQDAQLVVTAFDNATGQFNISFQNLTQEAQRVLDLESNRKLLMDKLEEKGYEIHIFQTTTQMEGAPIIENKEAPQQSDRDNQKRQNQQQQQGKRNFG